MSLLFPLTWCTSAASRFSPGLSSAVSIVNGPSSVALMMFLPANISWCGAMSGGMPSRSASLPLR